jgi:hypothetical protein
MTMTRKSSITTNLEARQPADYLDQAPAQDRRTPSGPFKPDNEGDTGSLLIFVPRNAASVLIDELCGRYGYSHLAVDCGEVDIPSGRRVMVESTIGLGVHNAFQDEYGDRHFVRIPLAKAGIDVRLFCDCIQSKLGQKYDDEEALTLGVIDDPAKQICSDLATVCLPQEMRLDIARRHLAGLLHPLAVVRHGGIGSGFRLFVSPNGFAEYFGAPRGRDLAGTDQYWEPSLPEEAPGIRRYIELWKLGAAALGCLALAWFVYKYVSGRRAGL